jgi:alpha-L-arabinofuranosidase
MKTSAALLAVLLAFPALAAEFHVAATGDDADDGSKAKPLRTISAAALRAQPGDVVTVHEGIYRERVSPPRGGESDAKRIIYQAAPGAKAIITGSEIVRGWEKLAGDTWKLTLPNKFFGRFNPYRDLIHGDWFSPQGRQHHTVAVYLNGHWLIEAATLADVLKPAGPAPMWYAKVDGPAAAGGATTFWAQFKDVNPNASNVEINVRPTVFTPEKTGINYITLRGFTLRNAATNWAPPSAGQIGLVSAYWCKGWVIENNDIAYSKCSGVALGKYSDEFDNTNAAGTADPYTACVRRALNHGWNKATVGSHIVRNNRISHCEQAGVVGSLGCSFSTVTGNEIHDIHVQRLFSGAEMAGIKFHGAIDVVISRNHIYRTTLGIWLDWMAQGAEVAGNLMHDNREYDLFCEVDHGPYLVANNVFLSPRTHLAVSQGGAYAHNLISGRLKIIPFDPRLTPLHKAHATELAGLHDNPCGDVRYYNNVLAVHGDLSAYDKAKLPIWAAGNVYLKGAAPCKEEVDPLVKPDFDAGLELLEKPDGWYLTIRLDKAWRGERSRKLVTTALLGRAAIPELPFENADGSPLSVNTDYFGIQRSAANPFPGPVETTQEGKQVIKVWPVAGGQTAR